MKKHSLAVRLDEESKYFVAAAADRRQVSISDYVRTVTVEQARREVLAAREQVLALTPEEQLAFWTALNEPVKLTPAQKKLSTILRGSA